MGGQFQVENVTGLTDRETGRLLDVRVLSKGGCSGGTSTMQWASGGAETVMYFDD